MDKRMFEKYKKSHHVVWCRPGLEIRFASAYGNGANLAKSVQNGLES
jgi:hypothetical protein